MSVPEQEMENSNRIMVYVERIVEIQQTVKELNSQVQSIRRDARSSGVDLDALNFLINMRFRHTVDQGASVVDHVIEYADAIGIEFERNPEMYKPENWQGRVSETHSDTDGQQYRIETDEEKPTHPMVRVLTALGVTALLLWLVH